MQPLTSAWYMKSSHIIIDTLFTHHNDTVKRMHPCTFRYTVVLSLETVNSKRKKTHLHLLGSIWSIMQWKYCLLSSYALPGNQLTNRNLQTGSMWKQRVHTPSNKHWSEQKTIKIHGEKVAFLTNLNISGHVKVGDAGVCLVSTGCFQITSSHTRTGLQIPSGKTCSISLCTKPPSVMQSKSMPTRWRYC